MRKSYRLALGAGLGAVVTALLLAGIFVGQAFAQQGTPGGTRGSGAGGGAGSGSGMMGAGRGVGMMSSVPVTPTAPGGYPSRNMMGQMMGPAAGITGTLPFGMQGMVGGGMMGMMGGGMMGMMNGGMMGMMNGGMMGGWSDPNAKPLTLDQAQAAAQKYISNLPNNAGANLSPMEVMEFANGFYVAVRDTSEGTGAFEVLVDRYTGTVSPEPGPNMMWNTTYGMAGQQNGMQGMMGMMGLWTSTPAAPPSLSEQQARSNAQKFLETKFPGAKVPEDSIAFPGYYTMDFEIDGRPAGMLSVNSYTGQVWYHTWHGQFLSERES